MQAAWRQLWSRSRTLLASLVAPLERILQVYSLAATETHEQAVHLVHHADVCLVEEDRVGAAGIDALRPCGGSHYLRRAW